MDDCGGQAWKATQWVQKSHAHTQLLPEHLENKANLWEQWSYAWHSLFPYNSQRPLEETHFTDERKGTGGEGTHHDCWCSHAPLGSSTDAPPDFGESLAHWRITKANPERSIKVGTPSLLSGNPESTPWKRILGCFLIQTNDTIRPTWHQHSTQQRAQRISIIPSAANGSQLIFIIMIHTPLVCKEKPTSYPPEDTIFERVLQPQRLFFVF